MSWKCGNEKPQERTLRNISGSAQTQGKPDKAEVQISDKTSCCCNHTCPNSSNASSAIHKIRKSKSKMFSCQPKQELQSNIATLLDKPVYECVVGNSPLAKNAFYPDPNWKPHRENTDAKYYASSDTDAKYDDISVTGAVETRQWQRKRQNLLSL